jgi:hypothetical protein
MRGFNDDSCSRCQIQVTIKPGDRSGDVIAFYGARGWFLPGDSKTPSLLFPDAPEDNSTFAIGSETSGPPEFWAGALPSGHLANYFYQRLPRARLRRHSHLRVRATRIFWKLLCQPEVCPWRGGASRLSSATDRFDASGDSDCSRPWIGGRRAQGRDAAMAGRLHRRSRDVRVPSSLPDLITPRPHRASTKSRRGGLCDAPAASSPVRLLPPLVSAPSVLTSPVV